MQVKTVELAKERPADVPAGWRIFNAPRPIYGHKNWTGDFITGCFYVAVDPNEANAEAHIRRNIDLDARELLFIGPEEFDRRVDAYAEKMAEEYGIDLDNFDRIDVVHSYQNWKRQRGNDIRF